MTSTLKKVEIFEFISALFLSVSPIIILGLITYYFNLFTSIPMIAYVFTNNNTTIDYFINCYLLILVSYNKTFAISLFTVLFIDEFIEMFICDIHKAEYELLYALNKLPKIINDLLYKCNSDFLKTPQCNIINEIKNNKEINSSIESNIDKDEDESYSSDDSEENIKNFKDINFD